MSETQWLAPCPVNFSKVWNRTNQELRVGIHPKPPSLCRHRGYFQDGKKAIVCCLRLSLGKPIIWLTVLKESSSNINNIDYHPLFFFPLIFCAVDVWGSLVAPTPPSYHLLQQMLRLGKYPWVLCPNQITSYSKMGLGSYHPSISFTNANQEICAGLPGLQWLWTVSLSQRLITWL